MTKELYGSELADHLLSLASSTAEGERGVDRIRAYLEETSWFSDIDDSELIQVYILRFCGCGMAEASLGYLHKVLWALHHLTREEPVYTDEKRKSLEDLFSSEGERYFVYYFLDREEYTEHGGSVPGWLTPKGYALLRLLQEVETQV